MFRYRTRHRPSKSTGRRPLCWVLGATRTHTYGSGVEQRALPEGVRVSSLMLTVLLTWFVVGSNYLLTPIRLMRMIRILPAHMSAPLSYPTTS